jgi:hypothetical protein
MASDIRSYRSNLKGQEIGDLRCPSGPKIILEALLHAQNRARLAGSSETSCPGSILASRRPEDPLGCSLYAVGERSLFHTLRNAPSVMGRAPAKRKTISPTMRSHSSLW